MLYCQRLLLFGRPLLTEARPGRVAKAPVHEHPSEQRWHGSLCAGVEASLTTTTPTPLHAFALIRGRHPHYTRAGFRSTLRSIDLQKAITAMSCSSWP